MFERMTWSVGGLAWAMVVATTLVVTGGLAIAEDAATADAPAAATGSTAAAPAEKPIAYVPATTEEKLWMAGDTVWVLVCGMLVFFMNLGFGCVESGFARAKNCVNILSKNFIVFAATALGFYLIGFDLMFGTDKGGWIGSSGAWMVSGGDNSPLMGTVENGGRYQGVYPALSWAAVPLFAKFFFQLVFAGTAATIVSGAVAERIKYHTFIIFSFLMALVIYPVTGHWIWGGGFLGSGGFWDFAGSTVVHSVGGWAALTGAIILGPRIGKYGSDGKPRALPGHNMTAAFIGCLVLWFGWFGFNPGSTMGVVGDGGFGAALAAVNTNSAAIAATLTATITAWLLLGKPDIGMTLNGCLAGLVAITAPAYFTNVPCSLIIGAIAGVLVVFAVLFFDRMRVDDPVGATSVHLVNGVFGTLCVGLFSREDFSTTCEFSETLFGKAAVGGPKTGLLFGGGSEQLLIQLQGVFWVAAYVIPVSALCWLILKYTVGLRVSPQEEVEGLDIGEHGNEAYHGFVMARTE